MNLRLLEYTESAIIISDATIRQIVANHRSITHVHIYISLSTAVSLLHVRLLALRDGADVRSTLEVCRTQLG
jgi:hypothetical protein